MIVRIQEYSPPFEGGVDVTSSKCREASFKGADGVVASLSQRATTPSAPIRRLRIIFLDGAATPPSKGGELPLSTVVMREPHKAAE